MLTPHSRDLVSAHAQRREAAHSATFTYDPGKEDNLTTTVNGLFRCG